MNDEEALKFMESEEELTKYILAQGLNNLMDTWGYNIKKEREKIFQEYFKLKPSQVLNMWEYLSDKTKTKLLKMNIASYRRYIEEKVKDGDYILELENYDD